MFSPDKWFTNPSTGFYDYSIDQSLRFEDGDSAYLTRTPSSAGNRRTFTLSCWIKRGNLGITTSIFGAAGNYYNFRFNSSDTMTFYGNGSDLNFQTKRIFRDTSSWYHLVVSIDTTQSSTLERVKIYINGTQETELLTSTSGLNSQLAFNNTVAHAIGRRESTSNLYADLYLAEMHWIDGTALTPSSFGETKDGIWIPKAYSGSYGTNGFYLTFQGTGTATTSQGTTAQTNIGDDQSSTGNNWAVSGLAASDVVPDSPTNNFATLNPLPYSTNFRNNLGNGNLYSNPGGNCMGFGTIALTTGKKWYMEGKATNNYNTTMGIFEINDANTIQNSLNTAYYNNTSYKSAFYHRDGTKYIDGSNSSYGAAFVTGDVIGMAVDLESDTNTITFYKNNASQGSFNLGANGLDYLFCMARSTSGGGWYMNFGQDSSFAGTKTSGSANAADGNGIGDFYYAPPSGFLALASSNLPEPSILDSTEYFNTVLWTGNATARSITGVGFSPDWCWMKSRTDASGHRLYDTVRGATKGLSSESDGEEYTESGLTSFDADGFSLGTQAGTNGNDKLMVGWNWLAGGTPTATNSAGAGAVPTSGSVMIDGVASTSALAGAIPATKLSANTTAGFSIVSYTGNGSADQTIAHGLSSPPQLTIIKDRDDNSNNNQWQISSSVIGDDYVYFTVGAFTGTAGAFPTSGDATTLTIGRTGNVAASTNESGDDFIMYNFHSVEGYSKVGSYIGNGSSDGTFVYTGFRPAFLIVKRKTSGTQWIQFDNKRDPHNETNRYIFPSQPTDEQTNTSYYGLDFVSNGFKWRKLHTPTNTGGVTYFYFAFAENPFKFANAR
jgi:hypothetical protein